MADSNRHNKILTSRQKRCLPLLAASRTVSEGCAHARINRDTFYRWVKNDNFKAELSRLREAFTNEAKENLLRMSRCATERLNALLDSRDENVRLRAICRVIESAEKFELDRIESRLRAIDEQIDRERRHAHER